MRREWHYHRHKEENTVFLRLWSNCHLRRNIDFLKRIQLTESFNWLTKNFDFSIFCRLWGKDSKEKQFRKPTDKQTYRFSNNKEKREEKKEEKKEARRKGGG